MPRTPAPRRKRPDGAGSYWYVPSEGRWRARYPDISGRMRMVSAATEAEILRRLHDALVARDTGTLGALPTQTPTLAQWLPRWLQTQDHLAFTTRQRYQVDIDRYLIPGLGRLRLDKITPIAVEDLYRRLAASGLRPPSVLHVHATLRRAMSEAHRLDIVGLNVMERVRAPKNCGTSGVALTVDEVRLLLDAAAKQGAMDFARWLIAVRWGLRQGEALGLRWCNVDLDEGRVHVREALQRQTGYGLVFVRPKSRAGQRTVPLDAETTAALVQWRKEQVAHRLASSNWVDRDLVFTNRSGGPVDPRNDYRAWKRLLVTAGVREVRLHDARHTAGSRMLEAGVDPRTVQEILGHSQWSITMDTYGHVSQDMLDRAAERLTALYAG